MFLSASFWEELFNALDYYSLIWIIVAFMLGVITVIAFIRFFLKKEIRLFKNIRRPIMIFKSEDADMEIETKLLKDSGLFNIPEEPTDKHQDIDRIKDHSLVIIGYSENMEHLNEILNGVKAEHIPLIVYSTHNIPEEQFQALRNYSFYSTCQVPLRLLNDAFTILATFPEKVKK